MMPSSGSLILLYHRVAEVQVDPQQLCVRPEQFAEQLRQLSRLADVVPLSSMHRRSSGPRVSITFDDGYADNALVAAPILDGGGFPATFFVTTGMVDTPGEFWWDRLERCLLGDPRTPCRLALDIGGREIWADARSEAARERTYWALHRMLREVPAAAIGEILDEIEAQLGTPPGDRPEYRAVSQGELRALAQISSIEIGAHSVTHPVLTRLDPSAQRREIAGSRGELEKMIGMTVESFAYPYGDDGMVDSTCARLVKEAGYARACANVPGSVDRWSNRWRWPRYIVRDWSAEEFRARVKDWLES